MYAVLRIDRLFQQNTNKDGIRSGVKRTDRIFQQNNKDGIIEECHQV